MPRLILENREAGVKNTGYAIDWIGAYGVMARIAGNRNTSNDSGTNRDFGQIDFMLNSNAAEDHAAALETALTIAPGYITAASKLNIISDITPLYAQRNVAAGPTNVLSQFANNSAVVISFYTAGNATFAGTITQNNAVLSGHGDLDVGDKLSKAVTALTAIKTAATDSNTDLAGLKAAIVSALANF